MDQTRRTPFFKWVLRVPPLVLIGLLLQGHGWLPKSQTIKGEWQVSCYPASDDCPNFRVSFDAKGGIVDTDIWGQNSRDSGFGRIKGNKLEINMHNIFVFKGYISRFHPTLARGIMDDYDIDGDDVRTRATVRRIGPLR